MAAAIQPATALLTLEEYLRTSYRPDCDFVDDHIEERNMGDNLHSLLQVELSFWFRSHREEWGVRAMTGIRTRVGATRVRLPDVAVVFEDDTLRERIRTTPPLIAIEVLSPDDRLNRVIIRLNDFLAMGIEHVWLLDPVERAAYIYTVHGLKLVETTQLSVPNSPIHLDLPTIFTCLDI